MSPTARFRRLAGAACLVLGPALVVVGFAILPWQTSDGDALDTLNLTGANITVTQIADLLIFAGFLLLIPALLAVMRAVGDRAPVLGLVGGTLSIAGAVAGMLLVVNDQIMIGLAHQTALRPDAAAALDASPAWVINVVLAVFLIGNFVGAVVLGAAFLRSRILPAWTGVVLIASPALSIAAHIADRRAIDVFSGLLQLAVFALLAQRVLATDDATWEAGGLAGPATLGGRALGATS
ncbi:MAG: hypothetical protein JHC74_04090 [Thermoleophilia bacterium]|nr:hypothetical protein [Thermoleophilia bacterium]